MCVAVVVSWMAGYLSGIEVITPGILLTGDIWFLRLVRIPHLALARATFLCHW